MPIFSNVHQNFESIRGLSNVEKDAGLCCGCGCVYVCVCVLVHPPCRAQLYVCVCVSLFKRWRHAQQAGLAVSISILTLHAEVGSQKLLLTLRTVDEVGLSLHTGHPYARTTQTTHNTHTHRHTYTHAHTQTYTHIHIHTHTHTHTHMHIHTHTHTQHCMQVTTPGVTRPGIPTATPHKGGSCSSSLHLVRELLWVCRCGSNLMGVARMPGCPEFLAEVWTNFLIESIVSLPMIVSM